MQKLLGRITFFVLLCGAVSGAFAGATEAAPLKVGVLLPLSGPVAELGYAVRNGLELGREELAHPAAIDFVFEDNQYDSAKTVAGAQKLIAINKVKALVVIGSQQTIAIADMVERARLPTISISTSPAVTSGRTYIMRHYLTSEAEGKVIAQEEKRRGYKSVAIVTTQNEATITVRDAYLKHTSLSPVLNEEVLPAEREFGALVSRIAVLSPGAVFLCTMVPQGGILARQIREKGYTGALFSAHPLEIDPEIKKENGALKGAWFVTSYDDPGTNFAEKYQKRFGLAAGIGASNGFDIAKILAAALNSADPLRYLHTLQNFKGALGTYGATPDRGFDIKAAVKEVSD